MTKVLIFQVKVELLEDKIWRTIEITDRSTVADLAYTIIVTFQALGDHLYEIRHNGKIYDSFIAIEDYHGKEKLINATKTQLNNLNLKTNDKLIMNYDTGSTITFNLTYLGSKSFEKGSGMHYPYITDGAGLGIINDYTNFELKEMVDDIDRKGKSNYQYLSMFSTPKDYDYRNFDLKKNNLHLKRFYRKIKRGYEQEQ